MQPISFPFNANHMFKMDGNLTGIICNITFQWSNGTILNRGCCRGALQRDNVIVSKEKKGTILLNSIHIGTKKKTIYTIMTQHLPE